MATLTQQSARSSVPGAAPAASGAAQAASGAAPAASAETAAASSGTRDVRDRIRRLPSRPVVSRRGLSLFAAVVVLGWSIVELASLAVTHTVGPELYGVLVAALAVVAGVADVILLRSRTRRFWISVAVVALWAVIALGGLAGVVAHIVGPVAGHGPVDTRPRPITAPLVFTALGVAGGAALFFGQRLGGGVRVPEPRAPAPGKE